MGSTYTVDMDIQPESYDLHKKYQMFIDLADTGVSGTMAEGTEVISGEVYARHVLSDGSYHQEHGLPHGQVHTLQLEVFTEQGDVLFDGLVTIEEDGRFTQEVEVAADTRVTVSATMSEIVEEVRTMERRTFFGTAVEEDFLVLDDGFSLTLNLRGTIWNTGWGETIIHEEDITCTVSAEVGRWTTAQCTGLERFTFSGDFGQQASRIDVAVIPNEQSDGSVVGSLVFRFQTAQSWPWHSVRRNPNQWSSSWSGQLNEYGVLDADVRASSHRVTSTELEHTSGFMWCRTELVQTYLEYGFEVLNNAEMEVVIR